MLISSGLFLLFFLCFNRDHLLILKLIGLVLLCVPQRRWTCMKDMQHSPLLLSHIQVLLLSSTNLLTLYYLLINSQFVGVEFFQEFNQRKHVAHDLHFDWEKYEDVVELKLDDPVPASHIISWRDYKTWDLVLLTKNYLRLMLCQLSDPTPGVFELLVRCVALFVSRACCYIRLFIYYQMPDCLFTVYLDGTERRSSSLCCASPCGQTSRSISPCKWRKSCTLLLRIHPIGTS